MRARRVRYFGLDQVNVKLPKSLRGRGEVDVVLTVDGVAANTREGEHQVAEWGPPSLLP